MPAPEGNKNALGNPGGGRPTMQDEKLKALVINKSWERINKKFEKQEKNELAEIENPLLEKELDIISLEVAKKSVPKDINLRTQKTISEILNDIEDEQV